MLGLLGKKLGMTRLFGELGESLPITVVDVGGNRVAQQKTDKTDGYESLQMAFGERPAARLTSPMKGHLAKNKAGAARFLREFRDAVLPEGKAIGDEISAADVFSAGQFVDVTGTSKGKGFAGVIKRHHFSSNRASHGNSRSHRKPGSTGQCQDPGRVFPGKKMPGRLGGKRKTAQNLKIARVDGERNLLLIAGAVPGAPDGLVIIRPAIKKRKAE